MGESLCKTSHTFSRLRTLIASTTQTYTLEYLRTYFSPSLYDFLLNSCRAESKISCKIVSVTQLEYPSHHVNFLYLGRNLHDLETEKVQARASTTRFPRFVSFCMMSFIHIVFFCSGRRSTSKAGFAPCISYMRFSFGSFGILDIRYFHPGCVLFTSPAAS